PGRILRYRARMALARSYLHQREQVETLTEQILANQSAAGQERLHLLNFCALALANVGNTVAAARTLQEASGLADELMAPPKTRMSLKIEATRAFEQQAEFARRSGDVASAARLLERVRDVWHKYDPATTYVMLRRARSEQMLALLRKGSGKQ